MIVSYCAKAQYPLPPLLVSFHISNYSVPENACVSTQSNTVGGRQRVGLQTASPYTKKKKPLMTSVRQNLFTLCGDARNDHLASFLFQHLLCTMMKWANTRQLQWFPRRQEESFLVWVQLVPRFVQIVPVHTCSMHETTSSSGPQHGLWNVFKQLSSH